MRENLSYLFQPGSVAVIGASGNPAKLGFHVMKSLVEGGFSGRILPINPKKGRILGCMVYGSLNEVPGPVDMAIIVLPARAVPEQIHACASKGVKGIVLITAGFREIEDPSGAELQQQVSRLATEAGIPIIGPNTFGMVNLHLSLNASFTPEFSLLSRGPVALVSQSGGISHLAGFLAMRQDVGFSKIIGLGNRANVDFAEVIGWLSRDDQTRVIAMYMEGLDAPRVLMEEAARASSRKPLVAYKAGRSQVANRASLSHTGSLAGRHEVYEGALRQAGIITVDSIEALLDAAKALGTCPLPEGPNVAVLSGQAGPGITASDVCEDEGLRLPAFRDRTQRAINRLLPPLAIRTNPVDMGPAWYDAAAIKEIVRGVLRDEEVHGVLLFVMFASANAGALQGIDEALSEARSDKPIVTCLSAPPGIWDEQIRSMEERGLIVDLPSPERASRAMACLWRARKARQQRGSLTR